MSNCQAEIDRDVKELYLAGTCAMCCMREAHSIHAQLEAPGPLS